MHRVKLKVERNNVCWLPSKTLLISKKGAHTVKPLPIRSIAALLSGMCAGSLGDGGANSRWDNAMEVNLAKLLFPGPEKIATKCR